MSGAAFGFAIPARHGLSAIAASIRRTFHDHIPLYICAALFCTATLGIITVYRLPLPLGAALFFLNIVAQFVALGIGLAALVQFIALIREKSQERPLKAIARRLAAHAMADDRPGNVFHSLVTLTPLMICFAAMKPVIPQIQPFVWDQTFMEWGRMIGFGTLPWQWLQPVLGYAPVTALLNVIYDCWFLIMFACLLWQAFAARSNETRMQFLLAFAFSWFIAGNVLATIFSSAGPCFYGYLHPGADPFGAQMAYLQNVNTQWPVWSLQIQDALWQSYVTGSGAVAGISAFPSMHVTIAVLLALLGTRTNRWLGIALWIFAGLIVIGSVHLAWHYAADSLAGIALAMLFWWSAGVVTRTWQKRCKVSSHDLPAPIC